MTNKSRQAFVMAQPKIVVRWDGSEDALNVLKGESPEGSWSPCTDQGLVFDPAGGDARLVEFGDVVMVFEDGVGVIPAESVHLLFEQIGQLSRGGAVLVRLPDSPDFFERAMPEWLQAKADEHWATDWERQELSSAMWSADSDMRDSIKRLATQLNRLHEGRQWGDTVGVGNAIEKAVSSLGFMVKLQTRLEGMVHRNAQQQQGKAAHVPTEEKSA